MSILLHNPKQQVGSDSSSWMTRIPELGPSGGGKERASGDLLYVERCLVTYIFALCSFCMSSSSSTLLRYIQMLNSSKSFDEVHGGFLSLSPSTNYII
jgi:hypothetical protein